MTIEEAAAAYILAYSDCVLRSHWSPGEREFIRELSKQKGEDGNPLSTASVMSTAQYLMLKMRRAPP